MKLQDPVTDAIQPLQRAAVDALTLAEYFRKHDLSRGQQGLSQFAAGLHALAIRVLKASPQMGGGAAGLNEQIGTLAGVLDTLISAQASEDWVTVADILEYDLEPAIRRWAALLEELTTPANTTPHAPRPSGRG